ncbi:hypothetical protein [Chryseobacterium indoltheticum]|uniref:hypothetical protein n=1 Tax=Chryseobacterium indoltheticum TaxID=254 RepID=UPI003F499F65
MLFSAKIQNTVLSSFLKLRFPHFFDCIFSDTNEGNKLNAEVQSFYLLFLIKLVQMISRKKIFYVPGLISALLIPILFWYFGNRKLQEPVTNVMDIGLPAKIDSSNKWSYAYSFEPLRNWNYKKYL